MPPAQPVPRAAAGLQWAADRMQLVSLHRLTEGKDVLVALIDSGIDVTHPELAGSQIKLVDMIGGAFKANAHGTSMAGAILSHGHLVGVAPGVRILELRAFDADWQRVLGPRAQASTSPVRSTLPIRKRPGRKPQLRWAFRPAAVAHARRLAPERHRSRRRCRQWGTGLATALPGCRPKCDRGDGDGFRGRPLRLCQPRQVHLLAAPGVDVLEPVPGSAYQLTSGTSVAAAHVSGIVALLLAREGTLGPDAVRKLLTDTASKGSEVRTAEEIGSGLVDGYRAIQAIGPDPAVNKVSISAPGT